LKSDLDFLLGFLKSDFLKSDLDFLLGFLKSDLDFLLLDLKDFFAASVEGISRLEKIMPRIEINNIPNMKLNLLISSTLM
jgi:hypothetical protein